MGTTKQRKEHIEWIENMLKQGFAHRKIIIKDALLALFAYKNFSTERTGLQILKMLQKLGTIEINGNDIYKGEKWK